MKKLDKRILLSTMAGVLLGVCAANAAQIPSDGNITSGGTYTLDSNATIPCVSVKASGVTLDLSANNPTVTLSGSSDFGFYVYNDFSASIKGGIWNFGGNHFRNGASAHTTGNTVTIDDGAVMNGIGYFYYGLSGHNDSVTVTGGSRLSINNDITARWSGDESLLVNGGAQVTAAGTLFTDEAAANDTVTNPGHNTVAVSGRGSRLAVTGSSKERYVGYIHPFNTLSADDGAELDLGSKPVWMGCSQTKDTKTVVSSNNTFSVTGGAVAKTGALYIGRADGSSGNKYLVSSGAIATNGYVFVGGDNSANAYNMHDNIAEIDGGELYVLNNIALGAPGDGNRFTVKNGGKVVIGLDYKPNNIYIGAKANHASGNLFEALEGTTVDIPGTVYVGPYAGTSGNVLVVSNAVFTATNLCCGANGSSGNIARIYGPNADLTKNWTTTSVFDIFDKGFDNTVEYRDGAVLDARTGYFRLGYLATNATLRLCGSAKLYATNNTFSTGRYDISSKGTRFEILDGSYVKAIRYRMISEAGTTVVSNATFEVTESANDHGFQVGFKEQETAKPYTDNVLVLQGATPQIRVENAIMTLDHASTMRVEVPADGYAEGFVPVRAKTFSVLDSDSLLTADFTSFLQNSGGRITIVETTGGVAIDETALAASNALLPEGCAWMVSADGKKLMLKAVKPGMTIIIR